MTISWTELLGRRGRGAREIAAALAEAVEAGSLGPGERLPTHRELARLLGIGVGTATRAYALARERRLISGEVGRGTFVLAAEGEEPERSRLLAAPQAEVDLGLNLPLALPSADTRAVARAPNDEALISPATKRTAAEVSSGTPRVVMLITPAKALAP